MELLNGDGGWSVLEVPQDDANASLPPRRVTRERTNTAFASPRGGTQERPQDAGLETVSASLKAFEVLHTLGEGGFGKVLLVRRRG